MEQEALKLELIEWLTTLENQDALQYLKVVKDSNATGRNWWDDLMDEQIQGINRGIQDIEEGRTIPHQAVKAKYGL